jgi:hypothetical protein
LPNKKITSKAAVYGRKYYGFGSIFDRLTFFKVATFKAQTMTKKISSNTSNRLGKIFKSAKRYKLEM